MTGVQQAPTDRVIQHWYRDHVSCLQSTLASLLIREGEDPLGALGLSWEFRHLPGDVRPEEFYWPCARDGDLVGSLLPYHRAGSVWRTAPDTDPLVALETALAGNRLPIVAVDNYHLPFRPAYQDVHSAHLIIVYGIDRVAGEVLVSDAMPPAYHGPLAIADLLRSWTSVNPREQEAFFSGVHIDGRWLDVTLGTPFPPLTPARLGEAMAANLARFDSDGPDRAGLRGLAEFGTELVAAARNGDRATVEEAYPFGWGMQAQAALHGELLRDRGVQWRNPVLAEAGRRVEQVAHAWTPVRVCAAYGRADPRAWAGDLAHRTARLRRAHEEALAAIEQAMATLNDGSGEIG
ncbi:BtrH N-terminal domain-containing protein [Kibdelosporangium persicum]|uniref:Butirosin biosynthesis protein H, N-terminal n=1 Tax=Kibdelosporangium persicum TaxID=2698649 RepID=A0ABX2FHH3_9PSEU|nr:BtrH N-terminal domain-containing protein [Kibdelosporangium persicum]NRN70854.1 Butirosin biosynthesis protein H, N-terminal [Kibdelosporangium persicum]